MSEEFDCGDEPYEVAVANYLRRDYWERPDRRLRTVLAFDQESGGLFGFGAWRHESILWAAGTPSRPAIRIQWFGVDRRFHGAEDGAGRKCAGLLYATVEADARNHEESNESMLLELFCDESNQRGLAFWERRGYQKVGTIETKTSRLARFLR